MDTSPKTISFSNKDRDHNIYTEEFFGGADNFIYINDVRYEDISAIQWIVRETLKPIYGYSSRKYDDVAVGTRIVQGVIKVPVRNTNANESLTFSEEAASNSLTNIGTKEVPNWVYKYTPDIICASGEGYKHTSADSSLIAKVQTALSKTYDYVNITGVNDINTQKAIMDYKRQQNLSVNGNIDSELLNRLNLADTTATTKDEVRLRYSPFDNSSSFYSISKGSKIIIQREYGEWYYIQGDNNVKGYIKKSEVSK